jgi:urease accessory protein
MTVGEDMALYRLLTWLSPAFPVGAFSYSQGLESAVSGGLIANETDMAAWLNDTLSGGQLWSDAVIFARAHDAACSRRHIALLDVVTFARAFQPSAELKLETLSQGEAFCAAVVQGWPCKAMDVLRQGRARQRAVSGGGWRCMCRAWHRPVPGPS